MPVSYTFLTNQMYLKFFLKKNIKQRNFQNNIYLKYIIPPSRVVLTGTCLADRFIDRRTIAQADACSKATLPHLSQ